MSKLKIALADWMVTYLKNRDLFDKKICGIDRSRAGPDTIIHYKDKDVSLISMPQPDDLEAALEGLTLDSHIIIVLLNNADNIAAVVSSWDTLTKFSSLQLFFVNPISATDRRWTIFPATHDRVCDKGTLGIGLRSMAENVEEISLRDAEKQIR